MKRTFFVALLVLLSVAAAFAWLPYRSAAVTSAATVQGSTTDLYGYYVYNPNASACSLDLFNATSGNVTLGTTVPVASLVIPATSAANLVTQESPLWHFQTALSVAAVTAAGGGSTCGTGMTVNLLYQ